MKLPFTCVKELYNCRLSQEIIKYIILNKKCLEEIPIFFYVHLNEFTIFM